MFHEPKLWESAPKPPAALRQVTAELSGTVVGQSPNLSIEFVLILQNDGPREIKILDPLDVFSLQFTTIGNKLIPMPKRVPKFLPKVGVPKDAIRGTKRDAPYPAPVQFRRIMRGNFASYEREEVITIPPGSNVQLTFESERVVMERVTEALRTETRELEKSFKARATMALVTSPPAETGGRLLDSDWILFKLPD